MGHVNRIALIGKLPSRRKGTLALPIVGTRPQYGSASTTGSQPFSRETRRCVDVCCRLAFALFATVSLGIPGVTSKGPPTTSVSEGDAVSR